MKRVIAIAAAVAATLAFSGPAPAQNDRGVHIGSALACHNHGKRVICCKRRNGHKVCWRYDAKGHKHFIRHHCHGHR